MAKIPNLKYDGPAELLDSDGDVIANVTVALWEEHAAGLKSWHGRIEPTGDMSVDWMDAEQIRLPDGETAKVFVTAVGSPESGFGGGLQGSGLPPWSDR